MDTTRKNILINSFKAGACHVGSSLSCVEILKAIYAIKGDGYFIFSKASGACALYQVLAEQGIIKEEEVADYLKKYPLASKEVPGVIHSVGSIGHGLNVAVGLAFADRTKKVYCLISDGELNEGSTWEALLFAGHHKLNNLRVVVDYNRLQACGITDDIINLDPLRRRIDIFDWCTTELNGHDLEDLKFDLGLKVLLPLFIVANTVKGNGVPEMEDDYTWHYKNISDSFLKEILSRDE